MVDPFPWLRRDSRNRTLFPHANNFVKNIVYGECAVPWYVYVETFFPAFVKLAVIQNVLLLDDIIRLIADEKAGDRRRPGVRRGRHGTLSIVRNEVTEKERFAQRGLRTLLTVTAPLEAIGYVVLLWMTADRFYYDWQTLIQARGPCSSPAFLGPFSRSRGPGGNLPILPGGAAASLPVLDQNRAAWANNAFSVSVPDGNYQVFWNANITAPGSGINGARASLRLSNSPQSPTVLGEAEDLGPFQEATLGIQGLVHINPPGGSIGWELTGPAVPVGLPCSAARVIVQKLPL